MIISSWLTSVRELFAHRRKVRGRPIRNRAARQSWSQLEQLEERRVMAFDLVTAYATTSDDPFFKVGESVKTLTEAPQQITLKFNEKVQPNFTGVELTMGGAPVKLTTTVAKDRMTLVGAPAKPFAAGVYQVKWHAVTADTHRMQGTYSFTVR